MTNCLGIFGVMSSGKDVTAGKFLRDAMKKKRRRVISNCYLNVPDLVRLSNEELYLKHYKPDFFKNSYLYITELHTILESRSSNALINKNFTMFLTQVGKIDCKIIYTSQLTGQIDLRMREFTPYRIICQRLVNRNGIMQEPNFYDGRILDEIIFIKLTLNFTDLKGEEVFKEIGIYQPDQEDFDFFDTREIIMLNREKFMRR